MRVAVLKGGRSLERQVSLRSGARVQDALERLGHEADPDRRRPDLVTQLTTHRPDVAFVALHGSDGEDGTVQELLEVVGIPHTGSGISACIRASDKVLAKHAMRDRGIPTPDFYAFNETALGALGAAQALPAIEDRLEFPIVVKPARQGSALGIKFARTAADVPTALVAAFSYDRKVLLERYVEGRELAVSILEEDGAPVVLPIVEAVPEQEDFYDFEARYEIGRTRFVCPPSSTTRWPRAPARSRWRPTGCSAARASRRVDLMLETATGELYVLEVNPIPGLTETSLLPLAAEAAGISFDELVERVSGGSGRPRLSAGLSRPRLLVGGEILRGHLVEEVLELLDDLLGVLDLVLELDGGLGDHLVGGEDRGAGAHGQGQRVARAGSRSPARGRWRAG